MSNVVTHAAERARERYGIELSFDQVLDIARRCRRGEGYVLTEHQNGAQRHTIIHGDRVLWVVWRATTGDVQQKFKRLGGRGRHEKQYRRVST